MSGDTADPDGDGIANLMEYALNLDPKVPATAGLPTVGQTTVGGSQYLTLTYTSVIAATGITYVPQVSGDLRTWNSGTGYTVAVSTTNNADNVTQTIVVPGCGGDERGRQQVHALARKPAMKVWIVFALVSMVFAGFTSVIAKLGLSGISGDLGLAVRTVFVFVFVLGTAGVHGAGARVADANPGELVVAGAVRRDHVAVVDFLLPRTQGGRGGDGGAHRQGERRGRIGAGGGLVQGTDHVADRGRGVPDLGRRVCDRAEVSIRGPAGAAPLDYDVTLA